MQRECTACPTGITRCAHLGDRVVWLADLHRVTPHWGHPWRGKRWTVEGPDSTSPCSCTEDHVTVANQMAAYYLTDSLAEAEAEFARRDALLREP